jgi:hypothetical protein
MVPGDISESVVAQRASWVVEMTDALRELPIKNKAWQVIGIVWCIFITKLRLKNYTKYASTI